MSASCQEPKPDEKPNDRFQMLEPAVSKLTSIDSLRVIRALGDAIRYSQLMACLEDAFRLTVSGPTGNELDAEIIAKFENYQMLLDIFADVTSWRRMAVADLHLPLDATEALIKSSYLSLVGLQGDNNEQVLDAKLLNELILRHSRLSGQTRAVPSTSDMVIQESGDREETNSSNIFYEVDSFPFDNENSSDENRTHFDELLEPSSYLQDYRGKGEPNEQSESDNDMHSDLSSSVPLFKGHTSQLPDCLTTHSAEHVSDFSRFVTSTRYLKVVHQEMQNKLRLLIRSFRFKPAAIERILNCQKECRSKLQEHKIAMHEYIDELKELKKLVNEKFLTTPLELLERQEYLDEVQQQIDNLERREHHLQNELNQETKLKQEQLKTLDDKIDELVHDLSLVQHLSTEYVKRVREDSAKQQKSDRNNSSNRHSTNLQVLGLLKADLTKVRKDYWAAEAVHRKKKYNLEEEIYSWIRTYDNEMTALQDEYDTVAAQYKIEKAQLDALEIRFAPLDIEFKEIMEERQDAYRARQTVIRVKHRQGTAAMTLQAWWRSYRLRKALTAKEKKLEKLAKLAKKG